MASTSGKVAKPAIVRRHRMLGLATILPPLCWAEALGISLMALVWLYCAARIVTAAVVKTLFDYKKEH